MAARVVHKIFPRGDGYSLRAKDMPCAGAGNLNRVTPQHPMAELDSIRTVLTCTGHGTETHASRVAHRAEEGDSFGHEVEQWSAVSHKSSMLRTHARAPSVSGLQFSPSATSVLVNGYKTPKRVAAGTRGSTYETHGARSIESQN